jgi:hypothetical protein
MGQVRRFAEPRLLMTAAMAFFSIALTINLTGVRVSELRMADLRTDVVLSMPSTARSFVERRLNMASTPIIRYYDNSRFAYEVQNGIKQLRRTTGGDVQGEGEQNRRKPLELNPGESKQTPKQNNGAPTETLQQSASPTVEPTLNNSDFLETSLRFQHCPAHSGGSSSVMLGVEIRERSTVWTA